MINENFELYHYNDKNFSGVESHSHNYFEFYFFLNGNAKININGNNYALKSGDMVILPPNVKHCVGILDTSSSYERFVFWITSKYCNELTKIASEYGYFISKVTHSRRYIYHFGMVPFNTLLSKLTFILEEQHFNRFAKDAKITICIQDLIIYINRLIHAMEHPQLPNENPALYQSLINYIEKNLDEDLSLEYLANEFYLSKYHIAHVFKKNTGLSIHNFITKKRLAACIEAILSNTDISSACHQCGFKDYSSFYRAFKKEYGMSPREYRELNKARIIKSEPK